MEEIGIFVGPLIPLFWTSGDVSRVGSLFHTWQGHICVTCSLRFTSSKTTVNLLVAFLWHGS